MNFSDFTLDLSENSVPTKIESNTIPIQYVPFVKTVGRGGQYRDDCGEYMGYYTLKNTRIKNVFKSCRTADCPVCYKQWASRNAINQAVRAESMRNLIQAKNQKAYLVHFTMDAWDPQEFNQSSSGLVDYWKFLNDTLKDNMENFNFFNEYGGCATVLHPFRLKKVNESILGYSQEWQFSPHIHGLGYIRYDSADYEENGVFFKTLSYSNDFYQSFGKAGYELGHCSSLSDRPRSHRVKYLGSWSAARLKKNVYMDKREIDNTDIKYYLTNECEVQPKLYQVNFFNYENNQCIASFTQPEFKDFNEIFINMSDNDVLGDSL